jgi:hypothetical protein
VNTEEGRRFRAEMTWAPGRARFQVDCRTACGCGCGRPARVEFSFGCQAIAIVDPVAIDVLVATLIAARQKLWGPPAKGGE